MSVRSSLAIAAAAVIAFTQLPAHAAARPAPQPGPAPAPQDDSFDQRLRIIERKLEIQAEDAQAKAKDAPIPVAGDKGFSLKSANGEYELKIRALAQVDGRFFIGDDTAPRFADGFTLRRLRPTFEGSLGKLVGFRLTPEFAGDGSGLAASIVDAYIDLKFSPSASVRAGKQKGPVGLERLQSGGAIAFVERGYVTELVPNRDIGVALYGAAFNGTANYTIGLFNGTPDGRDIAGPDADDRHEGAARVFFEPFRNDPGFFQGLGFGVGVTHGTKVTAAGGANQNNALPRYRSPGQNQFFNYVATASANGTHTRYSPQLWFYRGSFGLTSEYASSKQHVQNAGVVKEFENTGYEVTTTYVLTGEDASWTGLKPSAPYVPAGEGWGALEVAARIGSLDVDDEAFTLGFASAAASVTKATSFGVGLNWYLTPNAKFVVDYDQTTFKGGAAANADRPDEKALFTRIQLTY